MSSDTPITITTLVIGADYTKALQTCIDSKVTYAEKHGYNFIKGGELYWDRKRPISWSKIAFLLDVCSKLPENAIIWQSDADVLITNPEFRIEDHILPLLPEGKDFLLTNDSCGHMNAGNIIFRNTAWARDFWKRVNKLTQFTYHIWWENAAIITLYQTVPTDTAMIEVTNKHKVFNAYLRGLPGEPLWVPGDFLVHFAGVYDLKMMNTLTQQCLAGETPRIPM